MTSSEDTTLMRTATRLKLDCALRVLEFFRRLPDPRPFVLELVARLQQLLDQARALHEQQQMAQEVIGAAIQERQAIASVIREQLAHIARLSWAVALREREAGLRLNVPSIARYAQFFSAAQELYSAARRSRATLVSNGMPEGMLEELELNLERCRELQQRRVNAHAASLAAGADLAAVAGEALIAVRHLDALNRIRFAADGERLAEWISASTVRWSQRSDEGEGEREVVA